MIELRNTETAFAHKTDLDLKRDLRLFRMMNQRWFVAAGKVLLNIALFIRFPIGWIVKPTLFRHFCGGESITDCDQTIADLARSGISSIPDYSAEGISTEQSYDFVASEISRLIFKARNDTNIPFAVFKPSGIVSSALLAKVSCGSMLNNEEQEAFERFVARFQMLCQTACDLCVPLMVDAEESWTQQAIDDLVVKMSRKFNTQKAIVYNTLQLYRTDRLSYLNSIIAQATAGNWYCGFKLVRGAYMEKERERARKLGYASPVFSNKAETDAAYNEALKICTINHHKVFIVAGTHNEESALLLTRFMDDADVSPNTDHIWFSQLYGMSDHISFNLAKAGYNVCKYLPYGPVRRVMPYLVRRAEENTSIAGQTGRELMLIRTELSRRKTHKT